MRQIILMDTECPSSRSADIVIIIKHLAGARPSPSVSQLSVRKVDLSDIGYMSYYGKLSNMAKKGGRRSALVRIYQ